MKKKKKKGDKIDFNYILKLVNDRNFKNNNNKKILIL